MLLALLTGCASWRPTTIGLGQVIEQEQPQQVRVTLADGTRLIVRQPFILGDALAGNTEDCRLSTGGGRAECRDGTTPIALLQDVRGTEVRRTNALATAALFLVVLPTVYILVQFLTECEPRESCS